MMRRLAILAFVTVLLAVFAVQAGPVLAAVEAKPTAPPTPTNPPPPTEEPPPPPTQEPPPPTPTEKPPAPATPVPTAPPPAAEQPPTAAPTAIPAQAVPTALPSTAMPLPPTATATAAPSPTARPPRAATATATPSPSIGHGSSALGVTAALGALPPWALPAGGAGLAFLVLFGVWIVVRFVHYTGRDLAVKQRMIAESEAARLEERRREVEAVLVGQKDWQRITGQVIADTLGQAVQLSTEIPPRVGGKPAPYFTVADAEGVRYTFTTNVKALQEVGLVKKRARPRPVASPVEPGLVWRHLAETWLREAGEVVPAVPTGAAWHLVVVR